MHTKFANLLYTVYVLFTSGYMRVRIRRDLAKLHQRPGRLHLYRSRSHVPYTRVSCKSSTPNSQVFICKALFFTMISLTRLAKVFLMSNDITQILALSEPVCTRFVI